MARRIAASARRAGIADEEARRIATSFLAMINERGELVAEEHHPDFLHTGRTAVILLEDVGITDPDTIAVSVLFDSMQPALHGAALRLAAQVSAAVQGVLGKLATLPAEDAELIEALVTSDHDGRLVAVTERLDHARHLHLADPAIWQTFHRQFERVYRPLAHRTHPRLAYRCDRWTKVFAERYLRV